MGHDLHLLGFLVYGLAPWVIGKEIYEAVAAEATELPIAIGPASCVVGFLPGLADAGSITIRAPVPPPTVVANRGASAILAVLFVPSVLTN
jgi:hypothetical protein